MQKTNPFPGMNPFMEQRWHDAHHTLIGLIRQSLGQELPENYSAMAERLPATSRHSPNYYPDLSILDEEWKRGLPPIWVPDDKGLKAAVANPDIVTVETPLERWVEVRHDDGELVTVIEVISPTNRESGRTAFLAKRGDYLSAGGQCGGGGFAAWRTTSD